MLKFTVFIALFGLAYGGFFGGGRFSSSEERPGREEFPRPPKPSFLRNVNGTERRAWFEIEHNKNATKAEIQSLQDQWAENQDPAVLVGFYIF